MKKKYKFELKEQNYSHTPSDLLCEALCDNSRQHPNNNWLGISIGGTIWVSKGYAWDGCTPSIRVFGLGWIGTPEGAVDYRTEKPLTYYASLVHDALTQFKACPRKLADQIFYEMLKEAGFELAWLYYIGVRAWAIISRKK